MHLFRHAVWQHLKTHSREQMQPMQLCICSGRHFEKTFENSLRRKIVQMQPTRLWICSARQCQKTLENSSRLSHNITQKHYLSRVLQSWTASLLQHNVHWWHHTLSWGWGCLHWKILSSQPEKAMNRWSQILTPLKLPWEERVALTPIPPPPKRAPCTL